MGILSPIQFGDFIEVLKRAYPRRVEIEQMLVTRLGRNLDDIATTGAKESDIFYLIQTAEAQGWTYKLLNSVRESRPTNPDVIEFAQQFKLTPVSITSQELELIVKANAGFLDVATWRSALGKAEMCVCRIEVNLNSGQTAYGTGFLVGPDKVITNYHVIEPVLKKLAKAEKLILRFDYKRLEDGTTLNSGTVYSLDNAVSDDWLIASSPYSQADLANSPAGLLPRDEELDFALLKVKGKPATERISKSFEADAPLRGFLEIPETPVQIEPGEPVLILQHPEGDYLKLAIDTEAGLKYNDNHTRVHYTTNTLPGSSGSPCFNFHWRLVALHHAGDPNYSSLHKAEYNQGIPFSKIWEYLSKRGIDPAQQ